MGKPINLGWGESVAVRLAFLENSSFINTQFTYDQLMALGYSPHEGDHDVIKLTKEVIKRQTGHEYEYILITNGATGGVSTVLKAYAQKGHDTCFTMSAPHFPLYPLMIQNAGLKHVTEGENRHISSNPVALIDNPSNPLGLMPNISKNVLNMPVIWDAVYANNVYSHGLMQPIFHDVVVGSYSKLTGFNGLRLGWIATNDNLLYQRMEAIVTTEYAGLSIPSTSLLLKMNECVHWDQFEKGARFWLNYNREEWSKLEKFFGGTEVRPVGMFYYSEMDESCKKLLEKANITYMPGHRCGTTDQYGRFNLGQDPHLIKQAVKAILKQDKI